MTCQVEEELSIYREKTGQAIPFAVVPKSPVEIYLESRFLTRQGAHED
jgi:hypothetical protein